MENTITILAGLWMLIYRLKLLWISDTPIYTRASTLLASSTSHHSAVSQQWLSHYTLAEFSKRKLECCYSSPFYTHHHDFSNKLQWSGRIRSTWTRVVTGSHCWDTARMVSCWQSSRVEYYLVHSQLQTVILKVFSVSGTIAMNYAACTITIWLWFFPTSLQFVKSIDILIRWWSCSPSPTYVWYSSRPRYHLGEPL